MVPGVDFANSDRQQLNRTARAAQSPRQIQLAPAEHLVGVDSMRQRHPRHRCTFDQGLFDDPPLLLDWAVLPLGSGSALAFDCDEFCGLRGSVHLRSKWARSICVSTKNKDVLLSHLCPDGYQRTLTPFLYSVLMNCLTCGLDAFRKFSEIELDKSSVVQLVPRGMGHRGLPSGGARKRWGSSGDLVPRR